MFSDDEIPTDEAGSCDDTDGVESCDGGVTVGVAIGVSNRSHQEEPEAKWGYAFAGAIALGVAALIQFAFGGLDEEALENLPAVVAVPYAVAGKLGLTVPLALLGLGLIVRDVLVNGGQGGPPAPTRRPRPTGPRSRGTSGATTVPSRGKPTPAGEEELETGEPIPEEAALPQSATFPKIAAIRSPGAGTPAGNANRNPIPAASQGSTGGTVELATAKYLKTTNPETGGPPAGPGQSGGFRRGRTHHTKTEE